MPDDRIYDAINIFKYSPTGQQRSQVGGGAEYQQRFRGLVEDVLRELWRLWGRDEIGFSDMPWNEQIIQYGDSARRWGFDIQVNRRLEPTSSAATYATAQSQGILAGTSSIMVHEAAHLLREANLVEEEVACRTLELLYYEDLLAGQTYTSRVTGSRCTARLLPNSPEIQHLIAAYNGRRQWHSRGQLVDHLLNDTRVYRLRLTVDFIQRSIRWWGGIRNRWLTTRGFYLNTLAAEGRNARGDLILEILESFSNRSQWQTAKRVAGDLDQLRGALRASGWLYDLRFVGRLETVQQTTGEYLGVGSPP
jgi:hypothetical protein